MTQKYGYRANESEGARRGVPCLICDDSKPTYSWTDSNGEGYCCKCGTPYQLMNGHLEEGESYPRINVKASWIPTLRKYWKATGMLNGGGRHCLSRDYPEQKVGREALNNWCAAHPEALPKPRFYLCGGCDHNHHEGFTGDCREDAQRFTDQQLDEIHGVDGWVSVEED